MVEDRVGGVGDLVSLLSGPETEVDVPPRHGKPLVEASQGSEHLRAGEHAGRGHGRAVPDGPAELEVTVGYVAGRSGRGRATRPGTRGSSTRGWRCRSRAARIGRTWSGPGCCRRIAPAGPAGPA